MRWPWPTGGLSPQKQTSSVGSLSSDGRITAHALRPQFTAGRITLLYTLSLSSQCACRDV